MTADRYRSQPFTLRTSMFSKRTDIGIIDSTLDRRIASTQSLADAAKIVKALNTQDRLERMPTSCLHPTKL